MAWNLILLYTNTPDNKQKNQRIIRIEGAFMCKAELIPLFITKQDMYLTKKEILFYHLHCQMLNTNFYYTIQ